MGIAASGVNMELDWYPAASLSLDEQCRFNFGAEPLSFRPPPGYMTVQGLSDLLWTQEQKTLERNVEDNPDEKLQEFQTGANFVHGAETPVTPNKLPFLEDADNKLSNVSERKNFDIIGLDDEEKHCPTTEGRDIKKSLRKSRNPLVADLDFSPKDAVSSKGNTDDEKVALFFEVHLPSIQRQQYFDIGYYVVGSSQRIFARLRGQMLELPCKKTTEFSSENSNISFENLEEPQLSQRAAVSDADTPSNSDPSEEPPDEKDNFQGDTEVVRTETNLDSSKCKNITFNRSEDEQALDEQQSRTLHVDDVVGCGIIWPSKKIFFTVDGIGTQKVFDFPAEKDTNLNQIFPYVSRCDIHINFGQQAFVNEENNVPNNKFNSAEILYDVIMSQEQTDPK